MLRVSVITPVLNEQDNIEALLKDLLEQSLPPTEILIVDAGSTDGTVACVKRIAAEHPTVRLLHAAAGAFPGAGRNVGLFAAKGEWVAFVDAGIRVPPDWLEKLLDPVLRSEPVDAILGNYEPDTKVAFSRAAALAYVAPRRALPNGKQWRGFFIASSAVRRELAMTIGGFPEKLRAAEDLLFSDQLEQHARLAYAPDAIVRWSLPKNLNALYRRFRTYAEHSLRAGKPADWLSVMARRYGALAVLTGPAFPLAAGAALLVRAGISQWRKPEFVHPTWGGRIIQTAHVAFLIGTIDIAALVAWTAWVRSGRIRVQ
jgi:glycosyltransferase involved in cell wall biosynthesis